MICAEGRDRCAGRVTQEGRKRERAREKGLSNLICIDRWRRNRKLKSRRTRMDCVTLAYTLRERKAEGVAHETRGQGQGHRYLYK